MPNYQFEVLQVRNTSAKTQKSQQNIPTEVPENDVGPWKSY